MKTKTKLIENKAKNREYPVNASRSPFCIYLWPKTRYGTTDELGFDIIAIFIVDDAFSFLYILLKLSAKFAFFNQYI